MSPVAATLNLRSGLDINHLSLADLGYPSPASEDICLTTPSLDESAHATNISPSSWRVVPGSAASSAALAPEPDVAKSPHVKTPLEEMQPTLDLGAVVGAAVDPAPNNPLSPQPAVKAGQSLRLPSFAQLGIAAPHSEQSYFQELKPSNPLSVGGLLEPLPLPIDPDTTSSSSRMNGSGGSLECIGGLPLLGSPKAHVRVPPVQSPLEHFVTTLTPPDDEGNITWASILKVGAVAMDTPAADSGSVAAFVGDSQAERSSNTQQSSANIDDTAESNADWLQDAINAMLVNLNSGERASSPIKVLSHALPCPSTGGHAFPTIISSLHDRTPTSPTCWINVFHALPGRFNLGDIPTSPPSTPGPPIGGDDYFTSKVFDSAVAIMDYQQNTTSLPQSPHPIVPPSSVDVSIVERYIPPSSVNEFTEMFNTRGPSLLVDRLVELSPENGSLIFIYPTKRGAETFMSDYLAPLLDPLVRAMVVVNGFSADMGPSLGNMSAVESMPTHDTMKRRIAQLCRSLSQTNNDRYNRRQSMFSLVYSAKEEVVLERDVWARDWWCKQEKPRIRDVISRYFRTVNRAEENKTPTNLIHEVLDGVATRPYRDGRETRAGIEISAFVIKRSR